MAVVEEVGAGIGRVVQDMIFFLYDLINVCRNCSAESERSELLPVTKVEIDDLEGVVDCGSRNLTWESAVKHTADSKVK
jgi:hypothetical protein